MSARRQTENSAPGHHFYFFETQRVSGITRGLSGRAGGKSTDHRTPGNRVGRMSSQRGAGGNLANWEAGTLRFAPRGVGRVDAGPPLPGVPAWGALGRGPWPPPWPGGARPGCREGRDFAGCSPSARERMFHRESQPGCRRAPSRLHRVCRSVRTWTNDRVWLRMLSIQWCEVPNTGRITSLRERYASVRLRARNSTALDAHVVGATRGDRRVRFVSDATAGYPTTSSTASTGGSSTATHAS